MTLREHKFGDIQSRNTRTGKGDWSRPRHICYVGKVGKNIDPLQKEGLHAIGRAISFPSPGKNVSFEELESGGVKGKDYSIPITDGKEMSFTFDRFKLIALKLQNGSDVDFDINYDSAKDTTVTGSSSTETALYVTDASGCAKNDLIVIDDKDATYDGFLQASIITKVDSDNDIIYIDPPLDRAPASGVTVKGVAGSSSSAVTGKDDIGIGLPEDVTIELMEVFFVWETFYPGAKYKKTRWWPRCQVKPSSGDESGNMAVVGVTIQPLKADDLITVNLDDGTTDEREYYGDWRWYPA